MLDVGCAAVALGKGFPTPPFAACPQCVSAPNARVVEASTPSHPTHGVVATTSRTLQPRVKSHLQFQGQSVRSLPERPA
jgi:hypothetical protein